MRKFYNWNSSFFNSSKRKLRFGLSCHSTIKKRKTTNLRRSFRNTLRCFCALVNSWRKLEKHVKRVMKADRTKRRCIARQQLIFSIYYPPHKKMRNECCEYGREGGKESGSRREARPTCVQGGAWRHRWLMAVINQPIEFHSVDISLPFPPLPRSSLSLSVSRSTTLEGAKLTRIIGCSTQGREKRRREVSSRSRANRSCWMGYSRQERG